MKRQLAIAMSLVAVIAMPQLVAAAQVLASTFDGVSVPSSGMYSGFADSYSLEIGVQATISGTGNFVLTTARLPVGALYPGTEDPTMFSMFFRSDNSNSPGDALTSFVFDSRVLGPHSAPLDYNFDPPVQVVGGTSYWLTLEATRAPAQPPVASIGIGWSLVDSFHYVQSWKADRSAPPGEIPTGNWSTYVNVALAYQLLSVPEPSTLALLMLCVTACLGCGRTDNRRGWKRCQKPFLVLCL